VPSILCKGKEREQTPIINTPSKLVAKHFVSMTLNSSATQPRERTDLESDEDEPLVVKIRSSRNHPSTDGLLEYRLEVAPAQLVRLAESGIKGTREPPEKDEWASEDDTAGNDDDSNVGQKINGPKPPPDPTGHLRLWIPACMVELAEPGIVEEYNQRKSKKAAKGDDKARRELGVTKEIKKPSKSMVSRRPTATRSIPGRAANVRKTKVQHEESDHSTLLSMPLFTRKASPPSEPQSRAESSKARAEREKHTKSVLNYLWLSDEDEKSEHVKPPRAPSIMPEKPATRGIPAPFPISLDKGDVSPSSDTHAQQTISRPTKTRFNSTHSQTLESKRYEPPVKSLKHTQVEHHTRSSSPSCIRPAQGPKVINTSIIEISSDDSDDSDIDPLTVSVQRPIFPPLMLTKARSWNKDKDSAGPVRRQRKTKPISRDGARAHAVIDLT